MYKHDPHKEWFDFTTKTQLEFTSTINDNRARDDDIKIKNHKITSIDTS